MPRSTNRNAYDETADAQKVTLVTALGVAAGGDASAANQTATQAPIPGGAATATKAMMVAGEYRSTLPTLTNGQQGPTQTDEKGNARVRLIGYNVTSSDGISSAAVTSVSTHAEVTSATARPLAVYSHVTNGSGTLDRQRGDTNGTVASPHAIASARWNYAGVTGGITDTSDVAVMAAGGASVRNYMAGLQYINTSAVASEIVVKDGSTVIWRGYAAASMTMSEKVTFDVPLRGTANTALNVAMLTTATATRVSAQGFQGV